MAWSILLLSLHNLNIPKDPSSVDLSTKALVPAKIQPIHSVSWRLIHNARLCLYGCGWSRWLAGHMIWTDTSQVSSWNLLTQITLKPTFKYGGHCDEFPLILKKWVLPIAVKPHFLVLGALGPVWLVKCRLPRGLDHFILLGSVAASWDPIYNQLTIQFVLANRERYLGVHIHCLHVIKVPKHTFYRGFPSSTNGTCNRQCIFQCSLKNMHAGA